MVGEGRAPSSPVQLSDILELHGDLSRLLREEVAASETRLRRELNAGHEALAGHMDAMTKAAKDAAIVHEQVHAVEAEDRRAAHARYDAWLTEREISDAVQARFLGIARYLVDLAGRNWRVIVGVLGVLGWIATGSRVEIGVD